MFVREAESQRPASRRSKSTVLSAEVRSERPGTHSAFRSQTGIDGRLLFNVHESWKYQTDRCC